MYRSKGKRILDILLAAMGLITSLPFFVVLPPLLWAHFQGNPFFLQRRPGLNGQMFTILKFRTMRDRHRPLSGLGKMLRRTSLDELPQFWNVLVGDMSVVGPRPLLAEYLPLYNPAQSSRHLVRPGLTGLAQINGRNTLQWEEKFEYDLHYVQHVTFIMDLRIILATALKLLRVRRADGFGMEAVPFKGNPKC